MIHFTQNLSAQSAPPPHKGDGVLRCSRYSFGPNRLHYCGPDANREIFDYLKEGKSDLGLEILLKQFKTLYPYLKLIAQANKIKDPFDERVVEAYWIGNELLESISKKQLYDNLIDEHGLKKKMGIKDFSKVEEKIDFGGLPHHSFHVFNVWKRTGHSEVPHTLESMDECRVSWGTVVSVDGPSVEIKTEPLIEKKGKLALGDPYFRKITRHLDCDSDIGNLKPGDVISVHWGVPCEVIGPREVKFLWHYTLESLRRLAQL